MRATERLRIASGDVPCLRSLLRGRRRRAMAVAFLAECNREDVARAHSRGRRLLVSNLLHEQQGRSEPHAGDIEPVLRSVSTFLSRVYLRR